MSRFFSKAIFFSFFAALALCGCSAGAPKSYLVRDIENLPRAIQEAFAAKGESDSILRGDEGYPFRLVYLCENRVYNFSEEPEGNFLLTSFQPILNTPLELKLSGDDRRRAWACLERKVWAEVSRVEDLKRRAAEQRLGLDAELRSTRHEQNRVRAEIEARKKDEEEKKRKLDAELRRMEEERQRKVEEEQRRRAEEERKVAYYRAGERDKGEAPPSPPPPLKITERGVFLVMQENPIYEETRSLAKILGQAKKYDVFEVLNTRRDENGQLWHQVLLKDRVVFAKLRRQGWTPEEKSFWVKNKLLAWVYPGDLSRFPAAKPAKMNIEDLQFTGKKTSPADKIMLYEVTYEANIEYLERVLGWIEDKTGIRRSDRNTQEMRALLKELAYTLWPISIQTDVLRGQIRTGFTPDQVVLSWGKPEHIKKTHTLAGAIEQWVYGENPFPHTYVYFENGEVKSWEYLKRSPRQ